MKVVCELENRTLEFELTGKQICEFIADDLYETSQAWKDTPRKEFVARMTEALYRNTDSYQLAKAYGLDELNDEMAEYFEYEFLDKDERREWNGERGYDCDDKGE